MLKPITDEAFHEIKRFPKIPLVIMPLIYLKILNMFQDLDWYQKSGWLSPRKIAPQLESGFDLGFGLEIGLGGGGAILLGGNIILELSEINKSLEPLKSSFPVIRNYFIYCLYNSGNFVCDCRNFVVKKCHNLWFFLQTPSLLCYLLKSDKLRNETEEGFFQYKAG